MTAIKGEREREPGVGCGAAVVADGLILLVKRRRAPEAGSWNLFGGKVGLFERVEDAILRETKEETGVLIRLTRFLQLTQMISQDGQHWVSPVWLAVPVGGEARPPDHSPGVEPAKAEAVAWHRLDAPPGPLAQAAREAIAELSVRR